MMKAFDSIFLDRDGVINVERPNDYVKNSSEFIFIEGAIEAIVLLSQSFKLFVITNQRGVGKGRMTQNDLDTIHAHMNNEIEQQGGKIEKIYCCTDVSNNSINRKPNIGMAFQAQEDYSAIDFSRSIMVGNSISDIEFGKKMNMYTILVGDKYPKKHNIYSIVDAYYENLYMFANQTTNK